MFSDRRMDEIICENCGKYARDYDHLIHWCHKCCIEEVKKENQV